MLFKDNKKGIIQTCGLSILLFCSIIISKYLISETDASKVKIIINASDIKYLEYGDNGEITKDAEAEKLNQKEDKYFLENIYLIANENGNKQTIKSDQATFKKNTNIIHLNKNIVITDNIDNNFRKIITDKLTIDIDKKLAFNDYLTTIYENKTTLLQQVQK